MNSKILPSAITAVNSRPLQKWTMPELELLGTDEDLRNDIAANADTAVGDANPS